MIEFSTMDIAVFVTAYLLSAFVLLAAIEKRIERYGEEDRIRRFILTTVAIIPVANTITLCFLVFLGLNLSKK